MIPCDAQVQYIARVAKPCTQKASISSIPRVNGSSFGAGVYQWSVQVPA